MSEPFEVQAPGNRLIAIVLAGGLGTRVRALHPECPKPMINILGRPFLHHLLEYLMRIGIDQIVISTGHMGDLIEDYFSDAHWHGRVRCIRESEALGTGGAIEFILSRIQVEDWFLVLNGDSIAGFSPSAMLDRSRSGADAVLTAVRVSDTRRFGSFTLDSEGNLVGFCEKTGREAAALINAGIYLLHPSLFPCGGGGRASSLELDRFPLWLLQGKRIAVIESAGPFIDIGTAESLAGAARFFKDSGLFPALG